MMGAVINIGAEIGAGTMIDMGAILGGRAIVGKNSHVGAGAVLAGVIEPASAEPVRVVIMYSSVLTLWLSKVFKSVAVLLLQQVPSSLKMFQKMLWWLVSQLVLSRKSIAKPNKKQR